MSASNNLPHTARPGQQSKDGQLQVAESVTSATAWSAIDPEEQFDFYKNEEWRQRPEFSAQNSRGLRIDLLYCHKLYPKAFDPGWGGWRLPKPEKVSVRGRKLHFAGIIDLMSRLSDDDLEALFNVAALLSVCPQDAEAVANWGEGLTNDEPK